MIFYETNFCLLLNWSIAHCIAGERMLATFGLTATEIQQVTTASQRQLHQWSRVATPIVRPRIGLLQALYRNRNTEIVGIIADARSPASGPLLHRLPKFVNHHLLTSWRQAVMTGEKPERLELEREDVRALASLTPAKLEHWSTFPVALAIPKPGLIAALHEESSAKLFSFVRSWEQFI